MLSRTADNLYWLSRYVERAEYLARILDATQRLSALPLAYVGDTNEWESAVATAGCATAFFKHYDEANEENVTDFLAFSTANTSSIRSCFETRAQQRARGAHRAHHGNVGRHQRHLARTQALRQRPDLARGILPLPALGAGEPRCATTAPPTAPCCATTPTGSRASASISSAPTTPRASST